MQTKQRFLVSIDLGEQKLLRQFHNYLFPQLPPKTVQTA